MKTRLLNLSVFSLCALMLIGSIAPLSTAAPGAPAVFKDKWINLKTPNFNIISNADESQTRKLALKLEQFRYVFSKIFNIQSIVSIPVTVIAFKSDSSFKPFKPLYNGKPANVAGYFQRSQDENMIALDVTANSEYPLSVIFHEYTHFLTSRTPREWPVWLTEGIAEVYSSFEVDKDTVTLGAPISNHVFRLREQFMPLETLVKVTHGSPIYNEGNKQTIFYAESWALTHYLMFADKAARRDELVRFASLYMSGMDQDKAFAQAFKTDYATMEKELRKYVQNSNYAVIKYNLNAKDVEPEMNLSSLGDAEVQYYLGDLLLQINRAADAVPFFKQAETLDPNLAQPYEGLGRVAVRNGDFSRALPQFKLAIERGSKSYIVHYYYAEALERQTSGSGPGVLSGDLANTVIAELKKAVELGPSFPYAPYMLAQTYMMTGEHIDEGIQYINTAIKLDPRNRHFLLVLAQLEMRKGDYDGAKKILTPLAADSDVSLREPASRILQQVDSQLAYRQRRRENQEASERESSQSTADTIPEGNRPTLIRKDKPGSNQSERKAQSGDSESASGGGNGGPSAAELAAEGRPSLNIDGAEIFEGTLESIACGRSIILVASKDGKLFKFSTGDFSRLPFLSHDPGAHSTIGCGPIKERAFIYYKRAPAGQKDITGEAVGVEFPKKP